MIKLSQLTKLQDKIDSYKSLANQIEELDRHHCSVVLQWESDCHREQSYEVPADISANVSEAVISALRVQLSNKAEELKSLGLDISE